MHPTRVSTPDASFLNVRQSSENGYGPVSVLLHGSGDGSHIWQESATELSRVSRVVMVDLRGHGDSAWLAGGDYRLETYIADVLHVIEKLDLQQLILIGHSLGGQIAIHLAAELLEQVEGMVLIDFGPDLNPTASEQARLNLLKSLRPYSSCEEYEAWLLGARPLLTASVARSLAKGSLRPRDWKYELKFDPAVIDEDESDDTTENEWLWEALARISCPVLLMRGAGSAALPRHVAKRMERTLPRGRLQVVEGAGHAVMLDNPQVFSESVISFVAEVVRAAPRRSNARTESYDSR